MQLKVLFVLIYFSFARANDCNKREAEYGFICVCNKTYCDTVPSVLDLPSGQYQLYETSNVNLGYASSSGTFSTGSSNNINTITVADLNTRYQSIIGFGGAFTDSAGYAMSHLISEVQLKILESYYGKNGIEYSLGRIPIGGTDFSLRGYTYCDVEDETLDSFALQEEDRYYKIPYVKLALEFKGSDSFKLFASAWSAPAWMKTNNNLTGMGFLKDEFYDLWAKYYVKFFDAYEENNITFWAFTTQNEPIDGIFGAPINCLGWTNFQMNKWIVSSLGPTIRNSNHSNLKIIAHDDQSLLLPILKLTTLSNEDVLQYIDGIGVHWYLDGVLDSVLDFASSDKKELFKLLTEASNGFLNGTGLEPAVELGSWDRAEKYISSILTYLNHGFGGWTDWNLALQVDGGPNWVNNNLDAPIIVDATAGEFFKQPMFYALGHFSKFLVPESVRLDTTVSLYLRLIGVKAVSFLRPDNKLALIIWNSNSRSVDLHVNLIGSTTSLELQGKSINTILYSI